MSREKVLLNSLVDKSRRLVAKNDVLNVRGKIISMFDTMGYKAIANEIRLSNKAKENALYGLKVYYNSVQFSDEECKNKLEIFISTMEKAIIKVF